MNAQFSCYNLHTVFDGELHSNSNGNVFGVKNISKQLNTLCFNRLWGNMPNDIYNGYMRCWANKNCNTANSKKINNLVVLSPSQVSEWIDIINRMSGDIALMTIENEDDDYMIYHLDFNNAHKKQIMFIATLARTLYEHLGATILCQAFNLKNVTDDSIITFFKDMDIFKILSVLMTVNTYSSSQWISAVYGHICKPITEKDVKSYIKEDLTKNESIVQGLFVGRNKDEIFDSINVDYYGEFDQYINPNYFDDLINTYDKIYG